MRSPFPGMDPYLETDSEWELFHGWMIRKLAEQTLPRARERGLWITVERAVYQREPDGELSLIGEPDALTWSDYAGGDRAAVASGPSTSIAPRAVHEVVLSEADRAVHKQDYLVLREGRLTHRVLAVVELLSPANKQSRGYGLKYREKRQRMLTSRTHFLELDFLRRGLNPSRELFPELPPAPYFLFLARKTDSGRTEEGYPVGLREPLPTIGLPAAFGTPDLTLDLQGAFDAAYELTISPGVYQHLYDEPVEGPLCDDDAAWVRATAARREPVTV